MSPGKISEKFTGVSDCFFFFLSIRIETNENDQSRIKLIGHSRKFHKHSNVSANGVLRRSPPCGPHAVLHWQASWLRFFSASYFVSSPQNNTLIDIGSHVGHPFPFTSFARGEKKKYHDFRQFLKGPHGSRNVRGGFTLVRYACNE